MATITGLTAARMQEIIDGTIVDADIIGDHLILTKEDGSTIDTGVVKGDPGAPGAPGANASNLGKGAAFPGGATDGDLFVRTDQAGDPLYKFTDGAWVISAGGLNKVTSFPGAPTDGDVIVRTDLNGSPMYAYSTENGWEQQPRMGAVTVPAVDAYAAGPQAAAGGAAAYIGFDSKRYDTDGIHGVTVSNLTGTVAKTNGSSVLTGTGTSFLTELQPYDPIVVPGGSNEYAVVSSIQSNTQLTVSYPFQNTSSGQTARHDNAIFVARTPGIYLFEAVIGLSTGALSAGQLSIFKNGIANQIAIEQFVNEANKTISTVTRLAAGDFLMLRLSNQSGSSATVDAATATGPQYQNGVKMTWLGGAGQTVDERGVPAARTNGLSALQTIPHNTDTAISWNSVEDYDTDNIHDLVTNPSRFTIKTPGLYSINASLAWNADPANQAGVRLLRLKKNGNTIAENDRLPNSDSIHSWFQSVSTTILLAAGDYVELIATQDSGVSKSVGQASGDNRNYFSISLVGSGKTVTPYARAYNSVTQAIPGGTNTAIGFNSERADNDTMHDPTTNNTRMVARTAGVYAISAHIGLSAPLTTGRFAIWLRKTFASGGNSIMAIGNIPANAYEGSVATLDEMAVGDYYEVLVFSAGAVTVDNGQSYNAEFAMVKVGAPIAGQTGIDPVEGTHLVGAAGEPAFQGNWSNEGGVYRPAGFYKDRGRVYISGIVRPAGGPPSPAPTSTLVFVLPVGYRPADSVFCVGKAYTADGGTSATLTEILISSDGNVRVGDPVGANLAKARWTTLECSFKL